jgi:hypothetical protein
MVTGSLVGKKILFPWYGGGDRPMVFYEGTITARGKSPRWVQVDGQWWACLDREGVEVDQPIPRKS